MVYLMRWIPGVLLGAAMALACAADDSSDDTDAATSNVDDGGECGDFSCEPITYCYVPGGSATGGDSGDSGSGSGDGSSGEAPLSCPECVDDEACDTALPTAGGCGGCGGFFCSIESVSAPEVVDGQCCYTVVGTGTSCGTG